MAGEGRQLTRPYKRGRGKRCSKCDAPSETRYCKPCRAAYMRGYRVKLRELIAAGRLAMRVKQARNRLRRIAKAGLFHVEQP